MLKILNKTDCCGCEACSNICPQKCITMVQDDWGFYYPRIDENNCIDCILCEKVCPFRQQKSCNRVSAYVVQSKDKSILEKSAAGGAFTTLSKCILENGGVSVGASFNNKIIMHTIVDNLNEVTTHSSSKYVQSRMFNIYNEVKEMLESGTVVLFSGTPCQVNALKNYLMVEHENLYTVDLICSGVASPKVFDEYIKYMEQNYAEVKSVNFKFKKYGYHSSAMQLEFVDGKVYSRSRLTDYMSNIYTSYIAMRPSCYFCKTKGMNRRSDLTIYDAWHYYELTGKPDNELGHTNVIINTLKGNDLFEKFKDNFVMHSVDLNMAINLDGNVYDRSISVNQASRDFFKCFNIYGLTKAIKKYSDISPISYFKEAIKPLLYRFGLLKIVKQKFSGSRC